MAKRKSDGNKVWLFAETREKVLRCCISPGNKKMGYIKSFSFPPFITCRKNAPCRNKCYAYYHVYCINKQPHACYDDNWYTYQNAPEIIWKEIEAACMTNTVFRYFVSGDIPDYDFLCHMVEIAKRQNHCQTLCFTKQFEFVNRYIEENGALPDNLHIIFSAWKGLKMDNPYHLPECHVIYSDGTTTAEDGKVSYHCSGNCTDCYCTSTNCFTLKKDEQVLIHQH